MIIICDIQECEVKKPLSLVPSQLFNIQTMEFPGLQACSSFLRLILQMISPGIMASISESWLPNLFLHLRILPKDTAANLTFFEYEIGILQTILSSSKNALVSSLWMMPLLPSTLLCGSLPYLSTCLFHLLTTLLHCLVLAHSSNSVNTDWMNEYIREWIDCYIIHC